MPENTSVSCLRLLKALAHLENGLSGSLCRSLLDTVNFAAGVKPPIRSQNIFFAAKCFLSNRRESGGPRRVRGVNILYRKNLFRPVFFAPKIFVYPITVKYFSRKR